MQWSNNYKNPQKYIYYYALEDTVKIDFLQYAGGDSPYSGTEMIRLTDSTYSKYVSGDLQFVGYRFPQSALLDDKPRYNETITLKTPDGMLVASQTYIDSGTTSATEIDTVNYMIHNGVGGFKGKTWAVFKFFTVNGRKLRTIEII